MRRAGCRRVRERGRSERCRRSGPFSSSMPSSRSTRDSAKPALFGWSRRADVDIASYVIVRPVMEDIRFGSVSHEDIGRIACGTQLGRNATRDPSVRSDDQRSVVHGHAPVFGTEAARSRP